MTLVPRGYQKSLLPFISLWTSETACLLMAVKYQTCWGLLILSAALTEDILSAFSLYIYLWFTLQMLFIILCPTYIIKRLNVLILHLISCKVVRCGFGLIRFYSLRKLHYVKSFASLLSSPSADKRSRYFVSTWNVKLVAALTAE